MAQSIIRIYDSEAQANKVVDHLRGEGYENVFQFSGPTGKGSTTAAARSNLVANMMKAHIWQSHAEVYADGLTKGKTLVVVYALFGTAQNAIDIMDSYAPSDSGIVVANTVDEYKWDDAAPLSSVLHLPVLTKTKLPAETLSGISSLTKGTAFLSNLLGIPLLKAGSAKKTTSMGMPLLWNSAAPLSSSIGMRTLSNNPTPLSSMLGLAVLTRRK
jgi:hypothetical protein